jgi:hypothetical protein
MKAVLCWNDGRRTKTNYGGALFIIYPWMSSERCMQTTFEASEAVHAKDGWEYLERSTEDVTERMAEAQEENDKRVWKYLRKGWELED